MPSPVELLWTAVKEKRYADIQAIIEANPAEDIVNSIHLTNGRSLIIHLLIVTIGKKEAKPRELIEYLLKHPRMNWDFQHPKTKETTISSILDAAEADADFSIIKCLKDVPAFILHADRLTYELAVKNLEKAKKIHQICVKKGESPERLERAILDIKKSEEILTLIRDITILHAVETDDPTLLDRLQTAGADPTDFLGEFGGRQLLTCLLKPSNTNIEAWLAAQRSKTFAELATSRDRFFASAEQVKDTQDRVSQVQAESKAKAAEILGETAAEREARMRDAITKL